MLDRRQSIAVVEGLTNNRVIPSPTGISTTAPMSSHTPTPTPTPPPPHSHVFERKFGLQVTGVGEGQSLVDAVSARSSPGLNEMVTSSDALVRSVSNIYFYVFLMHSLLIGIEHALLIQQISVTVTYIAVLLCCTCIILLLLHRTRRGEYTPPWSCLGVLTEPYSSLVSAIMYKCNAAIFTKEMSIMSANKNYCPIL